MVSGEVKSISDLVNLMKIEKIRQEKNLENVEISLHSVFMGPPGTGKQPLRGCWAGFTNIWDTLKRAPG